MGFVASLEDNDVITMDIPEALNYLNGTMDSDLGAMITALQTLNASLEVMQNRQYSVPDSSLGQDYKDFAALTEAINQFLNECNTKLDEVVGYVEKCKQALNS